MFQATLQKEFALKPSYADHAQMAQNFFGGQFKDDVGVTEQPLKEATVIHRVHQRQLWKGDNRPTQDHNHEHRQLKSLTHDAKGPQPDDYRSGAVTRAATSPRQEHHRPMAATSAAKRSQQDPKSKNVVNFAAKERMEGANRATEGLHLDGYRSKGGDHAAQSLSKDNPRWGAVTISTQGLRREVNQREYANRATHDPGQDLPYERVNHAAKHPHQPHHRVYLEGFPFGDGNRISPS